MIHVLVVDDEPHVVEAIRSMLQSQTEFSCQVQTADSAARALNILKSMPIDLLISDICMPGLTGIDLAACVSRMRPQCKIIFLTAHSEFTYAYEGIKYGVLDYMLKTDRDAVIMKGIIKALSLIETEQKKETLLAVPNAPSPAPEDVLFSTIMDHSTLTFGECAAIFRTLGFGKQPLDFILIRSDGTALQHASLRQLTEDAFHSFSPILRSCALQGQSVLLMQFPLPPMPDLQRISRVFSSVARLYLNRHKQPLFVDIVRLDCDWGQIRETDELLNALPRPEKSASRESIRCFSLAQLRELIRQDRAAHDSVSTLISFMRTYISQHIHEEITLDILAQKTGYSSDYLSVIFKQRLGESYHHFLCRQKLEYIKSLMRQPELSLDDVRIKAGFKSRSYFNHFIKKEAAMPPRQLRSSLLKSKE